MFTTKYNFTSILLALCILLFSGVMIQIHAEEDNYKIQRISLEDGVTHTLCYSILQDSKGFMWFGTMFGLAKYDGRKYTFYKHDPADSSSISYDDIVTIYEDSKGNLWIGTYGGGLNKLNHNTGKFTIYDQRFFNLRSDWDGRIWDIKEDKAGNIWIGSGNAGLLKLNPATGEYEIISNETVGDSSFVINHVRKIFIDENNIIWLGSNKNGLQKFDPATRTAEFISSEVSASGEMFNSVYEIYNFSDNEFWLGTDKGVVYYDKSTQKFIEPSLTEIRNIPQTNVEKIIKDRAGNYWFGTTSGLYLFNPAKDGMKKFEYQPDNPASLSSNSIVSICEDNSGILWIGSYGGGVDKIFKKKEIFKIYRSIPNNDRSLSSNRIYDLKKGPDQIIWIATKKGLNYFDPANKNIKQIKVDFPGKNILDQQIFSVEVDKIGNLWAGTAHGLYNLDNNGSVLKRYGFDPKKLNSISSYWIKALFIDGDDLWIGTNNGLNRLNLNTGKLNRFMPDPENPNSITGSYILSLNGDSYGNIWAGTYAGLNRFEKSTNNFTLYSQDNSSSGSLSNHYVFSMLEDRNGNLWFGTGNGLNKFNRENNTFSYITEKNGLANSVICSILEDAEGRLFLSTHKGISRYNPHSGEIINYSLNDGLQSNMFAYGVGIKIKNGAMIFGGINGMNIFNPGTPAGSKYVPPIYITSVKKYYEPVLFDQDITSIKKIELSYDENFLTFEFAALDFLDPGKIKYKYMLEGIDKNWILAGSKNQADYTNLPPGSYKFKVSATNSYGYWGSNPTVLAVIINPPFWQTTWFFTIVTISVFIFLIVMHRVKVRKEITKSLELEKVKQKENEKVRKKAADDFHDELGHRLTKISLYSELVKRGYEFNETENFTYVNKIGEISGNLSAGVRDFIWTLDPEKDSFFEVAVRLKDFGEELFDKTGIAFRVDGISENFGSIKLSMDFRRHIILIFKEAMNNIVKYAKCANVTLSFNIEGEIVQIRLKDDGIGFNKQTETRGRGLKSMATRANSAGGKINILTSPGEGTAINLSCSISQLLINQPYN